ncbi:uncharacterized protein LOC131619139 [Vicia villosa]|uniref:uncharacterized protein LOC131619139 n=1 Tax=Vicia villosa TaxID=3911 RepID=UPI00273B7ED8|nr:uncharacterized protein LOC131619139 [Vicia villosa]
MRKKDKNELFYIHQCVDTKVFEKIVDSTTAKVAWDTIVRCYGGKASVKKVRLQSIHKQYEILIMKKNEKVPHYISRMIMVTNEMKARGETLSEQVIIEKKKKQAWLENTKKNGGGAQKSEFSNKYEKKHKNVEKGKEKFDKRKVQFYNYKKFGHFAADYRSNKERKVEQAKISRGDSEDEPVLLMAFEIEGGKTVDWWYMDTSCSNNLT